jgi:hypothetical protein
MHGLNSKQVAECKFSYCIPIHGHKRPILEALLIVLNYVFFILAWKFLESVIVNLVLTEKVGDFIKDVLSCAIMGTIAGTISYKIRKFQGSPVPTNDHNTGDVLCWECCWHWLCMVCNFLGCVFAIIWVLVFSLRLANWNDHEWAGHEYESGESKGGNRIMLALTAISLVMHIYYGLFVATYQSVAYYRLKKYDITVRDQVRHQGDEEANEARRMQPFPNQGTNNSGGMPGQPMGYDGGIQMEGGPQPGTPMG